MPMKIRCPHCKHVLVAEDEQYGRRIACPMCRRPFSVPLPSDALAERASAQVAAAACPRCKAELSPTATVCPRCATDLKTGKRLPLRRRLQRKSVQFWASAAMGIVVISLLTYVGIRIYQSRARSSGTPVVTTQPAPFDAAEPVRQLLEAETADARQAALRTLRRVEARIVDALTDGLRAAVAAGGGDAQRVRNQVAAIDLLGSAAVRGGGDRAKRLAVLAEAGRRTALADAAWQARGRLGDAEAFEPLAALWREQVARLLFLEALAPATAVDQAAAADLARQQAQAALDKTATALRALAGRTDVPVFAELAAGYWSSWHWLGQVRGAGFGRAMFALAAPEGTSFQFDPAMVREPRDVLGAVGMDGTPDARAAAGLILREITPQYRSLRRRIAEGLKPALFAEDLAVQQRVAWALSLLVGKLFGDISQDSPLDVTAEQIAAAQRWAFPQRAPAVASAEQYPQPPDPVYRAATPAGQLQRELLADMRAGWRSADDAWRTWLQQGFGVTPGIMRQLDPGQRRPNLSALSAAMVIVVYRDHVDAAPALELWATAQDQPQAIRALALTTLAALDARRGLADTAWPIGTAWPDATTLTTSQPSWDHLGAVLAAGGQPLIDRLFNVTPRPFTEAFAQRLLTAAQRYRPTLRAP
jgi:ribosomal protein L40E